MTFAVPLPPVAPEGVFPYGTHIHREPGADPELVAADLPMLRDAGFTLVKIQGHWAHDEPEPGRLSVERTERLITAARAAGLGVYLGLTMEQAPGWLWRRHPDACQVDAHGHRHNDPTAYTLPADGKPGPCWHHPGVRAAAESFVRRYVARMAVHDAIWVWNTWQEIGFWHNDAGALGFCYCPHTLEAFRGWLRERYGDPDGLNRAWRTRYGTWDEVEPPRRYGASPAFLDWREFMDDVVVTGTLAWRRELIRAADPARRPVFGHLGDIDLGSTKAWRYAATGDLFGVSAYPAWHPFRPWDDVATARPDEHATKRYEMWDRVLMQFDLLRAACGPQRPGWGAEFQGGPISDFLHLGRTPDADDIRRWVLGALAAGAHGVTFWNLRSEPFWQEAGGFGLLGPAGAGTARFAEAGRLAQALGRHAALFAQGTSLPAPAAILLSERQHHHAQGSAGDQAGVYLEGSVRGHHLRLTELGVPVDFVDADAAPDLSGYRLVVAPAPLLVTTAAARLMSAYVAQGGTLLAEAPAGWVDEHGFAFRTGMFDGAQELFGARSVSVRVVDEPGERRWTPRPRGWGEFRAPATAAGVGAYAGESVALCGLLQELEIVAPDTTAVLAVGGTTVAVRRRHGAGTAVLAGTVLGLTGTAYRHEPSDRFVARLAGEAGVVVSPVPGVGLRERRLGTQRAVFVVNLRSEAAEVLVRLPGATATVDLLGLPLSSDGADAVRLTVPALDIRCLIVTAGVVDAPPATVAAG